MTPLLRSLNHRVNHVANHVAMALTAVLLVLLGALVGVAPVAAQSADLDVPFVVSPPNVTKAMLDIANVRGDDFVLDLGSGDGRIVILAAKQYGARGLGVEIDPALVANAKRNAERAGVSSTARFAVQDLFATDLSIASVITMYLLPDVNLALRPKLLALKPGTRVVSHDWDMGDWVPDASVVVDTPEKKLGKTKQSRVMRWTVPANVAGLWCASEASLLITQKYQKLTGTFRPRNGARVTTIEFASTMKGTQFVIANASDDLVVTADVVGNTLTAKTASATTGDGLTFTRSTLPCAPPKERVAINGLDK